MKIYLHKRKGVNIPVMHTEEELDFLREFVTSNSIDVIVNIGTWYAGLESMFDECTKAEIYGFDKEQACRRITRIMMSSRVALIEHDVLKQPSALIKRILHSTHSDGVSFLYCDGGNKIREIEYYAPMLCRGDWLGTHDWGSNKDKYFADKLNGFIEIGRKGSVCLWHRD